MKPFVATAESEAPPFLSPKHSDQNPYTPSQVDVPYAVSPKSSLNAPLCAAIIANGLLVAWVLLFVYNAMFQFSYPFKILPSAYTPGLDIPTYSDALLWGLRGLSCIGLVFAFAAVWKGSFRVRLLVVIPLGVFVLGGGMLLWQYLNYISSIAW